AGPWPGSAAAGRSGPVGAAGRDRPGCGRGVAAAYAASGPASGATAGAAENGIRAPIAAARVTTTPIAISTSPAENTLPNGTQEGAAQRSTNQARLGEASATLLLCTPLNARPAARIALGSAGMWPPLVAIAARFNSIPPPAIASPRSRTFNRNTVTR